jgi:hypothetical protein
VKVESSCFAGVPLAHHSRKPRQLDQEVSTDGVLARVLVRRVRGKKRIGPTMKGMVLEVEVHCAHLKILRFSPRSTFPKISAVVKKKTGTLLPFANGLRDNETRGERDRTASGSGGAHQQLPLRETHR